MPDDDIFYSIFKEKEGTWVGQWKRLHVRWAISSDKFVLLAESFLGILLLPWIKVILRVAFWFKKESKND